MKKLIFAVFGTVLLIFGICNPCFAGFTKEPYLQYVVNASDGKVETKRIKILWETDSNIVGTVYYKNGIDPSWESITGLTGTETVTDDGNRYLYEVLVTGLLDGTKYDYKVLAGNLESDEFTFTTATPADDHHFSFVVFGDVQCRSEECRKKRAAVVKLIDSLSPKPDFLVSTGDMWWDNDRSDVKTFFDVDQGTDAVWTDPDITILPTEIPRLLQNYPLFPTYGNHEDREQNGTNRFTDYFVIPTPTILTTDEADAYYFFDYGNSRFIIFNTEIDYSAGDEACVDGTPSGTASAQYCGIKYALETAGSDNKFVFMHRGAHSNGPRHGSDENPQLSQVLGPLFRANNVDIVFQGHDHFYERFKPDTTLGYPFDPPNIHLIEEGVTYIVTGGGGSLEDPSSSIPPAGTTEMGTGVEHPLTSAVSERTLEAIHVQVLGDQVYVRVMTVDEGLYGASADLDEDGITAEPSYLLDYFFIRPSTATATRGLQWLRENQNADGSWYDNPAITGLGALAFLNAGYTEDDPHDTVVRDAIDYITGFVQTDGSITSLAYPNYETSIGILPLVATYNDSYDDEIEGAKNYLLLTQNTENNATVGYNNNNYSSGEEFYGGWGYPEYPPSTATDKWADLSNTQWTLMGLHFAYDYEGEAWVDKALTWVDHCQNDDGGLTYNGTLVGPKGTDASYASMTYAGIWSYALLGLDDTSPEISAALGWVESNYSITDNLPFTDGFALYYNYVTMAKALAMIGVSEIDGHLWQEELTTQLASLQHEDGHWVNTNPMEWEGVPELCTAYSILALQAFQDPPANLSMEVILWSPADLVVYDPQGRSCSKDVCNIPGATFNIDSHQSVTLSTLESGHYRLEIIGTGNGTFSLTVNGYRGDEQISSISKGPVQIKIYEILASDVLVSSLVGPLTIDMVQGPELTQLPVAIDIKPGSDPNSINLKSRGVVPVAILTTVDLDANDVDPVSCMFAGAYPVRWNMEDVDNDGDFDMILHYKTQELDLTEDNTEATLVGETISDPIIGTDSVKILPKSKK